MHDSQVEDQLRAGLRAEAERIPFTIGTAELERRLAARQRASGGRRISLLAAAVAAIAIGSIVAVGNGWLGLPAIGVTALPTPTNAPSTAPSGSTAPSPGARVADPLGSPGEAVLVRPIGDRARPDSFEVSRFDPLSGVAVEVATVPGTMVPADGRLATSGRLSVSLTGWLAIPIERGPIGGDVFPAVLVVDLKHPTAPPVVFNRYVAFSWNGSDGISLMNADGQIDLAYPSSDQVVRFAVLGQRVTITPAGRTGGPATSTEDGSRFLATQGVGSTTNQGTVGYDGVFTPKTDLPPVFGRTGLERPAGVAAHTLRVSCGSGESAPTTGCLVVEDDATGMGLRTVVLITDASLVDDAIWAIDGSQTWILLDGGIVDGARAATLSIADAPAHRTFRAQVAFPPSVPHPAILGITSETEPGRALLAIGDEGGRVLAFVTPDGTVIEQDGSAWFAGWAGQQPDYDPD